MRNAIKTLWSWFTRIALLFSFVQTKVQRGRIFGVKLHGWGKQNCIFADDGEVAFSDILIRGNNNRLINSGKLDRCNITMDGNDNQLELLPGAHITCSTIVLRGNHCHIVIEKNSDIGGMNAVCQGQSNEILIGKECLFSTDIELWASDTHTIYDENGSICNHSKSIHIGDHVWLGKGVAVLKGCSIADGSVIGMRSLVTRDIPAKVIAAGNPAKVIKSNVIWDRAFIDL